MKKSLSILFVALVLVSCGESSKLVAQDELNKCLTNADANFKKSWAGQCASWNGPHDSDCALYEGATPTKEMRKNLKESKDTCIQLYNALIK